MPSEQPEKQFKYWAFICYSHLDEDWAQWLHRGLETYHVPKRLINKPGRDGIVIPSRVYPVFRDRDELPGSAKLTEQIEEALRESLYLIVICSPRAATSQWVNQEIRIFKSLGREDRVLCLIIDGEPNADQKPELGQKECFPEAARFWVDADRRITEIPTEPIAADARKGKDGKSNALLKLLSGILGVHYSDLKQRDEERRKNRLKWILAGTITLFLLVLTVSIQFYLQKEQAVRAERQAEDQRHAANLARDEARRALGDETKAKLAAENARLAAEEAARQEHLAKEQETKAKELERAARNQAERSEQNAIAARNDALAARNEAVASEKRIRRVLSSSDLTAANRLIETSSEAKALAYLSRALRYDPENSAVVSRLVCLISQRSWPLPPEPLRHETEVRAVRFSANGQLLASISENTARLWNAKSGKLLHALQHKDLIQFLAFSPDGKKIVTCSRDGIAQVWECDSGNKSGRPLQHDSAANVAAFSPDGTLLAVGTLSHKVHIWSLANQRQNVRPLINEGPVRCLAFHPQGTRLLVGAKNSAYIWDIDTGERVAGPMQHEGGIYSAAFSPSGKLAATASGDKTARIWDASTGLPTSDPLRHGNWVNSVQFSPDERLLVTASSDNTAKLWELPRGRAVSSLQHEGELLNAQFSPNARLIVTASADNTATVWDVSSGRPVLQPLIHGDVVYDAVFSPDGKFVATASADSHARVWSIAARKPLFEPLKHNQIVYRAVFNPANGTVATASADRTARIWEIGSGRPLTQPLRHDDGVVALAFSPDGHFLATGSQDGSARVWDAATGNLLLPPFKHGNWVNSVVFSPDGKWLATACDDRTAKVWDVGTGEPVTQPIVHDGAVKSAFFSNDGKSLMTCLAGKVQVWDLPSGKLKATLRRESSQAELCSAAVSPDGGLVAAGFNDNRSIIWSLATGEPIAPASVHEGPVTHIAFMPGESWSARPWVLTVADKIARVWDVTTGKPITEPIKHVEAVRAASFSPDGALLATASGNSALVWESATGRPVSDPLLHQGTVNSVAFNPDGKLLITSSADQTARTWFIALPGTAPQWLGELASALGGYHLDDSGAAQMMPDAVALLQKTRQLLSTADQRRSDPFHCWGKWLTDDEGTRSIWAFDTTPVTEYVRRRIEENTEESLYEVLQIAPNDALALAKLAFLSQYQSQAEFYSSLAERYEPQNPEVLWIRAKILEEQNRAAESLVIMERALAVDPRNVKSFGPAGTRFCTDSKDGIITQGWLPQGWSDRTTATPMRVIYTQIQNLPVAGITALEMKTISPVANFAYMVGPRLVCKKGLRYVIEGWARSPYKSDLNLALAPFIGLRENYFEQTIRTTTEWKPFRAVFTPSKNLAAELVIREPSEAVVQVGGIIIRQE